MYTLENLCLALNTSPSDFNFYLADDGVSGTYFIKKDEKFLAVFKDSSQDPLTINNPRLMSKIRYLGTKLIQPLGFYTAVNHTVSGQSYVSDQVSNLFAQKMQLKHAVVPHSVISTVKIVKRDVKGSLIEWINNAQSLTKYTNTKGDLTTLPAGMTIEAFEEAAIFDYITGNMDRKIGNFLVNQDDSGNAILYLIDNSWAFSPKQGESLSPHQYDWGKFSLLKERNFSLASKDMITTVYTNRYEYAKLVFNEYCKQKPPGEKLEISYERAMRCLHRIEMLHYLIVTKHNTFSQLSQVKFEDTYLEIYSNNTLNLSSHFIDLTHEHLTENGIVDSQNSPLTPTELQYAKLFTRPSDIKGKITLALHQEITRLCQKKAERNWSGLWRKRYEEKVENVVKAMDNRSEEEIIQDIKNSKSKLYNALNTHTSFFFKCSKNSWKTTALQHMEETIRQHGC